MFVSKNQFVVFIVCVFFGSVAGLISEIFLPLKNKNKFLCHLIDVVLYFVYAVFFIVVAHLIYFPTLRAYMIIGFFTGKVLYSKSLGIILAKFVKKSYNNLNIKLLKRRKRLYDGKKV